MRPFLELFRRVDGATAVETALALVVAFPFMIGMVEFARAYWHLNSLELAAARGARYAMINSKNLTLTACAAPAPAPAITGCSAVYPVTLPNCAAYQTSRKLIGFRASSVSIAISCTGSPPTIMSVTTTSTFDFIASRLFPYGPITLRGTATVPLL